MSTLFGHEVIDLDQESDGGWAVKVVNRRTGRSASCNAKFVSSAPAAARCRCCRSRA